MEGVTIVLLLAIVLSVTSVGYSSNDITLTVPTVTVGAGSQIPHEADAANVGFVKVMCYDTDAASAGCDGAPFLDTDLIEQVDYEWFASTGGCYRHTWTMDGSTVIKVVDLNYANFARFNSVGTTVSDTIGSAGDPFNISFANFDKLNVDIDLISAPFGIC